MFGNFYYQGHKVQIMKMFKHSGDMLVNFKVWGTGEIKQGVKIEELKDSKEQSLKDTGVEVSKQDMSDGETTKFDGKGKEVERESVVSDNEYTSVITRNKDEIKTKLKTTPKTIEYVFTRIKDGKEFPVNDKGLDKFIKDNKLNMDAVKLMIDGKQKTHKGFSVKVK
jgi:hypothetical protein